MAGDDVFIGAAPGLNEFVPDDDGQDGSELVLRWQRMNNESVRLGHPYAAVMAGCRAFEQVAETVRTSDCDAWFDGGACEANQRDAVDALGGIRWHIQQMQADLAAGATSRDSYPRAEDAWTRCQRAALTLVAYREWKRTIERAESAFWDDLQAGLRDALSKVGGLMPSWAVWAGLGLLALKVFRR
jgi:hypothetical protein